MIKGSEILVKGLVQGVGFRPYIYRLANKHRLSGEVDNRSDGVLIIVQGEENSISQFQKEIVENAPPASCIKSIEFKTKPVNGFTDFKIVKSKNLEYKTTEICPDITVCAECLNDLKISEHRFNYPFINCTNCGPRFTMINALPYDRDKTTMEKFTMCKTCAAEYHDMNNRRFHAQPVACNICGPQYSFKSKTENIAEIDSILPALSFLIEKGKIVAIKGLGGYHLMCDAFNNNAIKELRRRKQRDNKPFAVLFRNIEVVKEYCEVSNIEEKELLSWRRPILLLKQKQILSGSINNGLTTIGAMLPYMPLHYLLFEILKTPALILTSGNISDQPIIIDDDLAENKLNTIADGFVSYNREIANRTDDSVVRVINSKPRLIRRSRGFVPNPSDVNFWVDGILALGAEQKNSFCIGKGNQAIMSQYIGDLKNRETYSFFTESIEKFSKLFRFIPIDLVCDKHPDYLSTRYAEMLEKQNQIPLVKVQHHHAHIASCIAEHLLDEKVIGVCFDGAGYGDDGNIWGGEFLVCDLDQYFRYTHFDYVPMPGGNKVIDEPWRMAISYLFSVLRDEFETLELDFLKKIPKTKVDYLLTALEKKINCPVTSSAGRLFDAVSSLINLCTVSTFDAETPMRLESIVDYNCKSRYSYSYSQTIIFNDMFIEILTDLRKKIPAQVISAKFHNTIIAVIKDMAQKIKSDYGINKVVLSGGTFQNQYLLEKAENALTKCNFKVYTPCKIPSNDGGIALGQMAIMAKKRRLQCV